MLACFTPYGKMACYHSDGSLRLLTDSDGGMLLNEVCNFLASFLMIKMYRMGTRPASGRGQRLQ